MTQVILSSEPVEPMHQRLLLVKQLTSGLVLVGINTFNRGLYENFPYFFFAKNV